ncbi:hypothetical protein CRUP_007254, partial [Coryphaenoides rupestris]
MAAFRSSARIFCSEVQLARALSERDSWKTQQEEQSQERHGLVTQIERLKCQATDIAARLQREREEFTAAKLTAMERVQRLTEENGALIGDNARIKESICALEQQLAQCEAAQAEERRVSEDRKLQTQQHQSQVAAWQTEVDGVKLKYQSLVRETENEHDRKDAEVEKLTSRTERLKSSGDMKESIQEANARLQDQMTSLEKKMEAQRQENAELVRRLANQDEAL